ncbi:phage tail assembly protein [Variovorax sp. YR216]|uniref:phage tail assembly protein n=1 Tax=Variovorax sp. YR216 TaxID=1882828 RepID=UPI0008967864|nr:phage tail assembly protein [Variovorax sp. YR216]SEA50356.1 Phage tail assembly chaperone protein, E, or 41 or 14 [Variovorax sp. YR216]
MNTAPTPALDQTTAVAAGDNTVTLDTPIQRGETSITVVTLRRPKAGELRGVALTDLLQLDVTALQTVLPRISNPMLLKQDVAELDPADLVQLGTKVAGFLLPKAALDASPSA